MPSDLLSYCHDQAEGAEEIAESCTPSLAAAQKVLTDLATGAGLRPFPTRVARSSIILLHSG